ncbi:hypothetical protein C1883_04960 [Pseudomonas protegens]|nr:hypothetical protein C1883_04960 [Pseudomonas protegens]
MCKSRFFFFTICFGYVFETRRNFLCVSEFPFCIKIIKPFLILRRLSNSISRDFVQTIQNLISRPYIGLFYIPRRYFYLCSLHVRFNFIRELQQMSINFGKLLCNTKLIELAGNNAFSLFQKRIDISKYFLFSLNNLKAISVIFETHMVRYPNFFLKL